MQRFFILAIGLLVFTSCKSDKKETALDADSTFEISTENWPNKTTINPKSKAILNNWTEFNDLETSFDALYTVENREDLNLVIEDLIAKQKVLAESDYPENFDKPQIKSRQKLFKTFVLKVKGDMIYRLDPQPAVLEMMAAFNAFRDQFNIIVNNTLDTKLILDE